MRNALHVPSPSMFRSSDQSPDNGDCRFVQCLLVPYLWPSCQPKKILLSCVVVISVMYLTHRISCSKGMFESKMPKSILCLWFRTSLIYINTCPTRCNTKQSIYYSTSSLYMFWVSTTLIIRSTQDCNYSLRHWSYFCAATSPQIGLALAWPRCGEVGEQYRRL